MNDDIHRAALRATAKVALSLTVIGCGGRVEIASAGNEGGGGAGGTHSYAPRATTASAGGVAPAPLYCDAADPGELVTPDPRAFACCADFLEQQPLGAWLEPAPELYACCNEVVGQIDQQPSLLASIDESVVAPVWPQHDAPSCCDLLGNPCSAPCGCTVWGPPVPRAIGARLWLLEQLEAA